jgi:glycosyltransferase involved in cell wall biosynthesis
MQLIEDHKYLDPDELLYLPFLYDEEKKIKQPGFKETQDFMSIGNFMHAPNEDAVLQLKTVIWPEIKRQLPNAQLHIYGSYCKQKHVQWHNDKEGFLVHGSIKEASEAFHGKRVLLAPLRYGAGLKGKIFDAMTFGMPVCTSKMGAEGMYGNLPPNGLIAQNDTDFIENAVQLYSNQQLWEQSQHHGTVLLNERFTYSAFAKAFQEKIRSLVKHKKTHEASFERNLLNYHSFRHLKFKSRWIEEKAGNKKA